MDKITLEPMTPKMYHLFFREYENDPALYLDQREFCEYTYEEAAVDAYIQRQSVPDRIPLAILYDGEIVGELKLYDIIPGRSAVMGIAMKNRKYKNKGIGTRAEQLAVEYAFRDLGLQVLYAACVVTNTRSQHVLEKAGFRLTAEDAQRKHYQICRENQNA